MLRGGQQLTWKATSYLVRASATDAVGGNMNQRWTATQRFQSSSEQTFTTESEDCQTWGGDDTPVNGEAESLQPQLLKPASVVTKTCIHGNYNLYPR